MIGCGSGGGGGGEERGGGSGFVCGSSGGSGGGGGDASIMCSRAGGGGVPDLAWRCVGGAGDMTPTICSRSATTPTISSLRGGGVSNARRSTVPTMPPTLAWKLPRIPPATASSGGRGARTRSVHTTQHAMTASGMTHRPARSAAGACPRELAMASQLAGRAGAQGTHVTAKTFCFGGGGGFSLDSCCGDPISRSHHHHRHHRSRPAHRAIAAVGTESAARSRLHCLPFLVASNAFHPQTPTLAP